MPGRCEITFSPGVAVGRPGILSAAHLAEHLADYRSRSLIVLGVGNDMCGDDGAGPEVVRRLAGQVPWQVIDAQTVPESFLMKIVDRRPEAVILIDALDFGAPPGCLDLFDAAEVGGEGPSTHGPAPLAFLDLLEMLHPCRRAVLGVQPRTTSFGAARSQSVQAAVALIVRGFRMAAREWGAG